MALFGKTDTRLDRPKYLRVGGVRVVTVTAGGSAYATAPAVVFSATPVGGVVPVAVATVIGGLVTAVTITDPGYGYVTLPSITFTGGGGTGAAATAIVRASSKTKGVNIYFVDATEVNLRANKLKGINNPGWWEIKSFYDQSGATRYKSHCLANVYNTAAGAGNASNSTIATVEVVISITTQPTNQLTVTGGATFTSAASITPSGAATYQWFSKAVNSTSAVLVNGATSATLVLTGQILVNSGTQYFVSVGSNNGGVPVLSNAAVLTFGS